MIKKMAAIVDGDVFTVLTLDTDWKGPDGQGGERIYAGFSSNPIFVEIPTDSEISLGWTWNGETFLPPEVQE